MFRFHSDKAAYFEIQYRNAARSIVPFVEKRITPGPGTRVLEIGCAEGGVLGVLCASIGSIQVTEAIKLLTGIGEPLLGRLMIYDALDMNYRTVKVRKDPNCAVCGENPTVTELIDYEAFCGLTRVPVTAGEESFEIGPLELSAALDRGEVTLIDVRQEHERGQADAKDVASVRIHPQDEQREERVRHPHDGSADVGEIFVLRSDLLPLETVEMLSSVARIVLYASLGKMESQLHKAATTEEALEYKNKGYLIAAERNGIKLDFADFGNSPDNFTKDHVRGRSIVYSTTNGTQTIKKINNGKPVVIASFINLKAVSQYIASRNQNVVIVCAGWKNKFNLEDSVFAGALASGLLEHGLTMNCDSAQAAVDLWSIAKQNPVAYIQKAMHRERLKKLKLDSILEYCFTPDLTDVVPVFDGHKIINATLHE